MLHITSALIGIVCAVIAVLAMLRAIELKHLVQAAMRGVMAIVAFVVLGAVTQMLLPGILTNAFLAWTRSSLFLGVGIVVAALALVLIAKWLSSAGSSRGSK
jgi:hypothetical protein